MGLNFKITGSPPSFWISGDIRTELQNQGVSFVAFMLTPTQTKLSDSRSGIYDDDHAILFLLFGKLE